jgi:glycosyltransferase involved in cell wall biosynthesis
MFCGLRHRRLVFRVAIDSDCEPSQLMIRYARDRRLYEFGLKRADSILVQSVTQQRAMLKNYGRQSTVTRSFVAKPGSSDSGRLKDVDVLWVSNIRQIKRPDRLLALARAMPMARFHMAGGPSPGEADLYRSMEDEARGIANLEFHGAIPYLDIGLLFDRAKVFANTSDLEGFPNTFLQAWVRGIPVVTMFDPDGVVGRKGLGSSHSSLEDMAAGLAKMLVSADAYQQASSASLEFMEEQHDEEKILATYLEAFTWGGNEASEEPNKASVA